MSQTAKILEYLQSGLAITPKIAYELYGCLALHSRISELREAGHDIHITIRTGGGKRWGEYRLKNAQLRLVA